MTSNDLFAPLTYLEVVYSKDSCSEGNNGQDWTPLVPVPDGAPPPPNAHSKLGAAGATYRYRDRQGNLCYLRCRFESGADKHILPLTYGALNGRIGWHWKAPLPPLTLYGLDGLAAHENAEVLVVEGEKCADIARDLFPQLAVVTSPSGAGAASKADWSALGGRLVRIWPDADDKGQAYAEEVAKRAHEVGATEVRMFDVGRFSQSQQKPLAKGWDVADAVQDGMTPQQGADLLADDNMWRSVASPASEVVAEDKLEREPNQREKLVSVGMDAELGRDPEHAKCVKRLAHELEAQSPYPETRTTDDDREIARLAALPLLEYERQRETAAGRLAVRVPRLDKLVGAARGGDDNGDRGQGKPFAPAEIEPWPQPVAGSQLLDDHVAAVRRHVILTETEAQAVALWAIHAHAHDRASISPLLAVSSPTPACGKSVLLKLLRLLVPRPLAVSNLTAASLFRAIECWGPTLLIDEADSYLKHNEELRGILDSGQDRNLAYVLRTTGDNHEPRSFCTWAPKAVAAIGKLPTTILSRSVRIQLQRMRGNERVDRLSGGQEEALKLLARKAARWVADHADNLSDDPPVPEQLRGRNADNWGPLIAIADQAGGPWPERARVAALALSGGDDTEALSVLLLHDLAELFDQRQVERIPTAEIIGALGRMETQPWPELSRGKPITPRRLAGLLGEFGIQPRTVRVDGRKTPKGYFRGDLDDALARYPRNLFATAPQSPIYGPHNDSRSATSPVGVADKEGTKPPSLLTCGAVADRNPENRPATGNTAPSRLDDTPGEPAGEWREADV